MTELLANEKLLKLQTVSKEEVENECELKVMCNREVR